MATGVPSIHALTLMKIILILVQEVSYENLVFLKWPVSSISFILKERLFLFRLKEVQGNVRGSQVGEEVAGMSQIVADNTLMESYFHCSI